MENLALQRELETKIWEIKSQAWESKFEELSTKDDKLMKQETCQLPVQGGKHIIWDAIIEEERKLRPYLDFVLDKEVLIQSSRQSVTTTREKLNKNPIDYANNTIKFLNGLLEARGIQLVNLSHSTCDCGILKNTLNFWRY